MKVIVKNPEKNIGFILCNHLCQRSQKDFTLKDVISELKQYHIKNKDKEIQNELTELVDSGILLRTVNGFVMSGTV